MALEKINICFVAPATNQKATFVWIDSSSLPGANLWDIPTWLFTLLAYQFLTGWGEAHTKQRTNPSLPRRPTRGNFWNGPSLRELNSQHYQDTNLLLRRVRNDLLAFSSPTGLLISHLPISDNVFSLLLTQYFPFLPGSSQAYLNA